MKPAEISLSWLRKMSNKALRILIADEQHFHRMKIERMLNQLGYYRIAPVHTLEEVLSLVEYGYEPFDLVIINASLTTRSGLDLLAFCLDNQQVRHALIYDAQQARPSSIRSSEQQKVLVSHAPLPDGEAIKRLMDLVDSPVGEADVAAQWTRVFPQFCWGLSL